MSSIIKVDTIQDQDGNNIINENANTVTVGKAGDTVNIVGTLQNNGAELTGDISSVVAGTGLSGGGTTGDVTLNVEAAQPGITSLGTITGFTSTGIDDNATSTAITINSSEQVEFTDGTASLPSITNSGDVNTGIFFPASDNVSLSSGGNEGMRLDSAGKLSLLKTDFSAAASSSNRGLEIRANGATALVIDLNITGTSNTTVVNFVNGNGDVGTIQLNGSATAYNTSSDYRLKENVNYDFDATTRLKQLRPARFNFIADNTKTVDGFIAHEVSSVVPEAISGEKDALQVWQEGEKLPEGVSVGDNKLDADGNTIIDSQGIDQSKLVPLLVKTIQELEARITTLENA